MCELLLVLLAGKEFPFIYQQLHINREMRNSIRYSSIVAELCVQSYGEGISE